MTQPIAPETEMRCPLCDVLMTYDPELHMWRCPVSNCRLEVWPPALDAGYKSPEEMFRDASQPPGGLVKNRSGSKKRKRKKRKKGRDDDDPWRLK